jgi:transcriptional regulator with XRE-family HTH domain
MPIYRGYYDTKKIRRIFNNRICSYYLGDCFFDDVLMDTSGQGGLVMDENKKSCLAENLRKFRKMLNVTQEKFAEPLSVTGSYISNLEKGRSNISEAVLKLMEKEYGFSRNWLLYNEGDQEKAQISRLWGAYEDAQIMKAKIIANARQDSHVQIKDDKDCRAAKIISGLTDLTWQEAMDQLDYVKDFLMNRVIIRGISWDKYLKNQGKKSDSPAKHENDKTENNKAEISPTTEAE